MQGTYLWQATKNLRSSQNITGWPIFSEPISNELSRLSGLSAEFWSCIAESKAAMSSNPQSKLIHLLQFFCVWQANPHLTYSPLYAQLYILLVNWQLNSACWNIHKIRVFEMERQKHCIFSLKCSRTKIKQNKKVPSPREPKYREGVRIFEWSIFSFSNGFPGIIKYLISLGALI